MANQYRVYIDGKKVGETPYVTAALVLAEMCRLSDESLATIKFCGKVVFDSSEFVKDSCMIVAVDPRDCVTIHNRSMDAMLDQ